MKKFVPNILIVLPMAYQDGIGKHNGIMRFLSSRNITWNIFFNRMTSTWADPTIDKKTRYDGIILDGSGPDKFYDAYRGIDCPTVTFDWHRNWHPGRRNSWLEFHDFLRGDDGFALVKQGWSRFRQVQ